MMIEVYATPLSLERRTNAAGDGLLHRRERAGVGDDRGNLVVRHRLVVLHLRAQVEPFVVDPFDDRLLELEIVPLADAGLFIGGEVRGVELYAGRLIAERGEAPGHVVAVALRASARLDSRLPCAGR